VEQFRDRLVEFKSLNAIRELIGELYASELGEPLPLPLFVVKSILEEVHSRLDARAVETPVWNQVRDTLRGPLGDVADAAAGDPVVLVGKLNALIRVWTRTRKELLF
jgi:hypothetical protein